MEHQHEGFFQGHGGISLFFQIWEKQNARGTLLISPGQGEHSESYHRLVEFLKASPWNIWAWDMRGHGRSEGKRGYASHFEDYVLDYRLFLKKALADDRVRNKPLVVLGHSMGGLVQLKTLAELTDLPIAGQVCSAPLLGLSVPVPGWKQTGSQVMHMIAPEITLWNEIKNDYLTRDPDVVREFEQDVLRHDRISSGVFIGFKPAWEFVAAHAGDIRVPTLFQLPEQDPVVSTPMARAVFENLGSSSKEILIYGDGARHEMYNDLHRKTVLADLEKYLANFLK